MDEDYLSVSKTLLSVPNPTEDDLNEKEQFLRFHLVPDTTLMLSITQLTEVLTIPVGQIIPIPHMPAWVMGVYNWRGEILWMVDLGQLVGLTPWYEQNINYINYKAIVLKDRVEKTSGAKEGGRVLGLVVSRVEDIEWCESESIQAAPDSMVSSQLAPFLRGYWLKSNGEIVIVLDGKTIMNAMPSQDKQVN